MSHDAATEVLKVEMAELNLYVRVYFQTYVAWFTFFITVLFTSMAWGLKTAFDDQRRLKWAMPVYLVYSLFALQISFGTIGTYFVREDILAASQRIADIQQALANNTVLPPRSPVPTSFAFDLLLMGLTLVSNLFFWGVVVGAVRRVERRGALVVPSEPKSPLLPTE